jgi:hypothetical protein
MTKDTRYFTYYGKIPTPNKDWRCARCEGPLGQECYVEIGSDGIGFVLTGEGPFCQACVSKRPGGVTGGSTERNRDAM